jgi:YD repeat-containing protein
VEGREPASPNALTYDALGRLASTTGSSVTQFAYAGDQLLSEYDGSGNLLRRYVRAKVSSGPISCPSADLRAAT